MSVMSDYYKEVNASYDCAMAFEDWVTYRQDLLSLKQGPLKGRVGVVGSGHLNDVDLKAWLSTCSEVFLFDADIESSRRGIAHQGFGGHIHYCSAELTGLDQDHFFEELSLLMAHKDMTGIERYLKKVEVKPTWGTEYPLDHVIVTPIYTQLVINQALMLADYYDLTRDRNRLIDDLMAFMVRVIEGVNDHVVKILKPGGTCYVWSDVVEYQMNDPVFDQLGRMQAGELMALIDAYEVRYGMGVGSYGIHHLLSCLESSSNPSALLWPFSSSRRLLVKMGKGKKPLTD